MKPLLRQLWEGWKNVAHWIGDKQTTLIYTVLYVLIVGPLAIVRRLFTDPLQYRRRGSVSFWVPRLERPATLEEARRQ